MNRKTMAKRFGLELSCLVMLASSSIWAMSGADLQNALDGAEEGGVVEVTSADVVVTAAPLRFTKSVTLRSPTGVTNMVRRSCFDTTMVSIAEGVTVRFENVIFDGRGNSDRGRFAVIPNGSTLTLGAGATLRNFRCAYHGGGIEVSAGANLVMEEDSCITGFTSENNGVAVCVNGGTFGMTGGIIRDCGFVATSGNRESGGAVYLLSTGSVFNFSGGLITGNTADFGSSGLIVKYGTVNLSGTATVTNNVGAIGNDIVIWKDQADKDVGQIIVSPSWRGWATFYSSYTPALSGNWYWPRGFYLPQKGNFAGVGGRVRSQNAPEYTMNANRGGDEYFYWVEPEGSFDGVPVSNYGEAKALAAAAPDVPHVWELARDYNFNATAIADLQLSGWCKTLTVKSSPGSLHTIRYGADLPIYTLDSADYTLRFEDIVLQGNRDTQGAGTSPLIQVEAGRVELGDGAILECGSLGMILRSYGASGLMEDGAVIRNCRSKLDNASAVSVGFWNTDVKKDDSPTFTMTGGVISNCAITVKGTPEDGYGGAIFVRRATFVMTGGLIAENTCDKGAAGVLNWADSTVRFGGTACVEGNVGAKDDVYLTPAGGSIVSIIGDFSGHVGISNDSQEEGGFFRVKKESGATGANGFFPSGSGAGSGLIGKTDPDDATKVVWGRPVSMLDGVWFGSAADFAERLPAVIDLADATQQAKLPYVCGGQLGGTVQVRCTQADLDAGTALFDFGVVGKSGKIAFELPQEFSERYRVRAIDSKYRLSEKLGFSLVVK